MAHSIVSKNFVKCVEHLKSTGAIKSYREFAIKIDYAPQNFSQIIKGKRDVTVEMLRSAIDKYHFNPSFLFGQSTAMLDTDKRSENNEGLSISSIPYVSESRYESYINNLIGENEENLESSFIYKGASAKNDARIFRINNNSLLPYISSGDRLFTKRIVPERWERLVRDDNIYVVVTNSKIHIAKVLNSLSKDDLLSIQNVDSKISAEHLDRKDILEIWEITHILAKWVQKTSKTQMTLEEKLDKFQGAMDDNGKTIKELNQTIQKLLKQNRSQMTMF